MEREKEGERLIQDVNSLTGSSNRIEITLLEDEAF